MYSLRSVSGRRWRDCVMEGDKKAGSGVCRMADSSHLGEQTRRFDKALRPTCYSFRSLWACRFFSKPHCGSGVCRTGEGEWRSWPAFARSLLWRDSRCVKGKWKHPQACSASPVWRRKDGGGLVSDDQPNWPTGIMENGEDATPHKKWFHWTTVLCQAKWFFVQHPHRSHRW